MRPGTRNIYFLPGLSIFMLEKKPAIFYCLYFCSAVLKAFYEPWYAYQHVSKKEKHVQLYLSIADTLYSGHLAIADRIFWSRQNPYILLIKKPLYSGQAIADTWL